jgi:hypothetical protein
MLTIWDHLLLWGAFFLLGLVVAIIITVPAMHAGKFFRL